MIHICPNCGHQRFSFWNLMAAATPHGTKCASCGVVLRMSAWRRAYAGSPLLVMVVWSIIAKPTSEAEIYALITCAILTLLICYISPLHASIQGQITDTTNSQHNHS